MSLTLSRPGLSEALSPKDGSGGGWEGVCELVVCVSLCVRVRACVWIARYSSKRLYSSFPVYRERSQKVLKREWVRHRQRSDWV